MSTGGDWSDDTLTLLAPRGKIRGDFLLHLHGKKFSNFGSPNRAISTGIPIYEWYWHPYEELSQGLLSFWAHNSTTWPNKIKWYLFFFFLNGKLYIYINECQSKMSTIPTNGEKYRWYSMQIQKIKPRTMSVNKKHRTWYLLPKPRPLHK
jgi:hypothetical protein